MRRLTSKQLVHLRGIATASLEMPESDRPDLGIAAKSIIWWPQVSCVTTE